MELLSEILLSVAGVIVPAIVAFIGKKINEFLKEKQIKEIVVNTVKFVEQTCKEKGEAKYKMAVKEASKWLNNKGLKVSEIELKILIESAVNSLTNEIKKEEVEND